MELGSTCVGSPGAASAPMETAGSSRGKYSVKGRKIGSCGTVMGRCRDSNDSIVSFGPGGP